MKTASLVLGIIGGALAVIFAIILIAGGALLSGLSSDLNALTDDNSATQATATAVGTLWAAGIASIVGAVLGIVGAAMAKKRGLLGGIFMIVGAIPSFFTGLGVIAAVLFIIGGILALIPQKAKQTAAA